MSSMSVSGTGRGIDSGVGGVPKDAPPQTALAQSNAVENTVVQAQVVAGSRSVDTSKSPSVMGRIGDALQNVLNTLVRPVQFLCEKIDAVSKKSPILGFALGLMAVCTGSGLLAIGLPFVGIPLGLTGAVLLGMGLKPFSKQLSPSGQ